jgi:cobalamin transport system ATP-binding protein
MLKAVDVEFAYGTHRVLCGVSLEVPANGLAGIIGPNGSGKTTLLKILAGTLRPSRGHVSLDGMDLTGLPKTALARRIAVVPQETQLAFDYSVLEVVLMGRYPHLGTFEIEGPADFEIARDALRATGTLGLEDRPFGTLSGGEKQRVIIASALAQIRTSAGSTRQPLLLLDEPTTALDLGYLLETAELLRALQCQLPIAIVVSTHDLNFAAGLCRSLILLKGGRIHAAGDTGVVLTPAHISDLYGVDADVQLHPAAGHLVVVPIARRTGGAVQ